MCEAKAEPCRKVRLMEKYCQISYVSPLGNLLLTFRNECLCGLRFGDAAGPAVHAARSEDAVPAAVVRYLDAYFAGRNPQLKVFCLSLQGTPFQQKVWQLLLEIPYGSTLTYGELAVRIARETGVERMSAQAIGQAVGRNPIALIIPCHRVVGAGGKLTGYAWGVERKKWLLEMEGKTLETKQKQIQ